MGEKFVWAKHKVHQFQPSLVPNYMDNYVNEIKLKKPSTPAPSHPVVGMDKIQSQSPIKKYLIDYASASTVHGLNHLVAPRRHLFEKLLIAAFIIGSLAILIVLSMDFWDRYQNYPTVIVLDHEYRGFNVTKPAIIVCPIEKVDTSKFSAVFNKYGIKDTEEARNFFNIIADLRYDTMSQVPDFTEVDPALWVKVIYDLRPDVEYSGNDDGIAPWIITENGVCMAFNNYVAPYSTLDYWEKNNWTVIPTPQLPAYIYQTREIFDTIKIKTHDVKFTTIFPGDILNLDAKFYISNRKTLSGITLLAAEITSSQQVKDLSLTQRKCKLSKEGGLNMWPVYTHAMCASECRYKQIFKICNCYPHFARPMPNIPICDTHQLRCISDNLPKILMSNEKIFKECKCYSDCDIAKYMDESSSSIALKEGSPPEALLNIAINFPTDKFKRELLFGFNDFLASVGGGAGLFLGASVISFIEILYFGTVRLFWYKMKLVREKKEKEKISASMVS